MEFELDGKKITLEKGSTILEAALKEGKFIPHFCYHKKLSIAANCRMCLVEVEKSPKPVASCATPITDGMKVYTTSKMAIEAQKGVMEFLLINHPLDCPVCDQGGECRLQDLAVGYGRVESRFEEEKRAVTNKDMGPLISTEMTRCIHCSRCVRFSAEIAGEQEIGMNYRNNHVEVMPFIGKTVNSELSGNVIDLCPVGALTSKPYRHKHRSWELSRRKTISPHDGLGSNLLVQVDKYHKVVRVLPYENENLNECWISDRDRFSYEGLYHEDRILYPMIKYDNQWMKVDWNTALNYVAESLLRIKKEYSTNDIGVLANSISTTEELFLLQKLMRQLDINNIDYRLAQSDLYISPEDENKIRYIGGNINSILDCKSILLIGCLIRSEQPLLALKIRQAVKNGAELSSINVLKQDFLCQIENENNVVIDPREITNFLAQILKVLDPNNQEIDFSEVTPSNESKKIANSLTKESGLILLGEIAKSHPQYSLIQQLVQAISNITNIKIGFLSGSANEVGAQLVGCVPYKGFLNNKVKSGMDVMQMLTNPRKGYVLFNTELERDVYNSSLALAALKNAKSVTVISPYINEHIREYADVILPITPFTETAGSYINMQGDWQKFNGVTTPLGDSKPGWKVIRVLANILNLNGFDYDSIDGVREEISSLNENKDHLNNHISINKIKITTPELQNLVRVGTKGYYNTDSIVRRASSLQQTVLNNQTNVSINNQLHKDLQHNSTINVEQGSMVASFEVKADNIVAPNSVGLNMDKNTVGFAGLFDEIKIKSLD